MHTLQQSLKPRKKAGLRVYCLSLKKAAPRFELGVEVLQTSALPLGYAAVTS